MQVLTNGAPDQLKWREVDQESYGSLTLCAGANFVGSRSVLVQHLATRPLRGSVSCGCGRGGAYGM